MISKKTMQQRVDTRKQEIVEEEARLTNALGSVKDFIDDIKSRSTIYALVKNLPLWKKLEALVGDSLAG